MNNIRNILLILFLFLHIQLSFAQIGGKNAFEFLNLPTSPRLTAMGGHLISVMDEDVSLTLSNPAALNEKMHNRLAFAHNFHFAGIQNGYVGYGRQLKKWDFNTHVGIQYINYGDFTYADQLGNKQDQFSVRETAFIVGASKKIAERLTAGANLKTIFSNPENYASFGMAADLGINYQNDSSNLVVAFVIKNIGYELTTYTGTRFGMPLDIQIGISKKLRYLPFRFSVIAHQLHRANARYDDPSKESETDIFGEPIKKSAFSTSVDNLFRHLIFNGEFLLGKNQNLRLRAGYNHMRRKELSITTFRSLSGFSFGFGVKVNAFKLDYGVGYHHLAGATNHIGISTDLGSFFNKM